MGDFTTAGEVESVTAHEVINNIVYPVSEITEMLEAAPP